MKNCLNSNINYVMNSLQNLECNPDYIRFGYNCIPKTISDKGKLLFLLSFSELQWMYEPSKFYY